MEITDELISYLEKLGKIKLDEKHSEIMKNDLQKVISYFSEIDGINTENTEPVSHSSENSNIFYEDIVISKNNRDKILSNAKNKHNGD